MTIRRVYSSDPGQAELLSVGGVVIIDRAPPGTFLGAGTGMVMVVGEFEKGPLNTPTEIVTPGGLDSTFGDLGWTITGQQHAGPVAQQSGGNEPWNGNGWIACQNKTFSRLSIMRVDNSSGTVSMERLATCTGGVGPFQGEDGDTITFELNGGPTTATGTLSCEPASIAGTGATFPLVSPIGGKFILISWDEQDPIPVFFTDTDLSETDIINRVNQRVAADLFSDDGGQLLFSSVIEGYLGRVQIHGGNCLTDLGLPDAIVPDVWTIKVNADVANPTTLRVTKVVTGLTTTFDTVPLAGPVGSVTLKRDALLERLQDLGVPGHTFSAQSTDEILVEGDPNELLVPTTGITALAGGADLTISDTTPGVALEVFGLGNVGDSQNISTEEAAAIIDAAANISGSIDAQGQVRAHNELTPTTGTMQAISGALATAFGFDTSVIADAANAADVLIAAGTRFQDETATATVWVAIEDVQTGTGGGPWSIKVRPFFDTDTAIESAAGDVTQILDVLADGFTAANADLLKRLTASQLDARYINSIQQTNVDAPPASEVNTIVSARMTTAIRRELVFNCLAATAGGLSGRRTITRPKIGATIQQAIAANEELRHERKQFAFPAFTTAINVIREVTAAGGIGFSDDGVINAGADIFLAAYRSVLRSEQSAAEVPTTTNYGPLNVIGLERAYDPSTPGSTKLDTNTYKLFKARGIIAARIDRTQGAGWVDDVTSTLEVGRTAANRRAFADFINDSLLTVATPYRAKIGTPSLFTGLDSAARGFLRALMSPDQPEATRLKGFNINNVTDPNVPQLIRMRTEVQMWATADVIVFETQVGPTVFASQEVIA